MSRFAKSEPTIYFSAESDMLALLLGAAMRLIWLRIRKEGRSLTF